MPKYHTPAGHDGPPDEFKKHLAWQAKLRAMVSRTRSVDAGQDALSTPAGKLQLALCVLGLVCALPSFSPFIVLFVPHIEEALSLSSSGFAAVYCVAAFLSAGLVSVLSPYVDQLGPRRMTSRLILPFTASFVLFAGVRGPITLAIAVACARAGGVLIVSSMNKLLARWFPASLSRAVGIFNLGSSLGMATPLLARPLVAALGWRGAFLATAAAVLGGLLLLVLATEEWPPHLAVPSQEMSSTAEGVRA